jgi:hypothetical protein
MDARQNSPVETTPGLGWARRVLRQQLDALSRLKAAARRLLEPAAPAAGSVSAATLLAAARNIGRALSLQGRAMWALRLIDALRARLTAELDAVENGQAPAPPVEARSFAAESESRSSADSEARDPAERGERGDRPERERFGFGRSPLSDDLAKILKRPTAEIIALICRELGLPADWPRLAEEAWAREAAEGDEAEPPCPPAPRSSPDPFGITAAPS